MFRNLFIHLLILFIKYILIIYSLFIYCILFLRGYATCSSTQQMNFVRSYQYITIHYLIELHCPFNLLY